MRKKCKNKLKRNYSGKCKTIITLPWYGLRTMRSWISVSLRITCAHISGFSVGTVLWTTGSFLLIYSCALFQFISWLLYLVKFIFPHKLYVYFSLSCSWLLVCRILSASFLSVFIRFQCFTTLLACVLVVLLCVFV